MGSTIGQLAAAIHRIEAGPEDDPIVVTDKGCHSYEGGRFVLISNCKNPSVQSMHWGSSGSKWAVERDRTLRQRDGRITVYP
jgi:hypothetical protein